MEANTDFRNRSNTIIPNASTDPCTAEDILYVRKKYTSQGFDYEAAKTPAKQKKVSWLAGMKRKSFAVGIGSWFRCARRVYWAISRPQARADMEQHLVNLELLMQSETSMTG